MNISNRDKARVFITKDSSEIREILAPRNSPLKRQSLAEATVRPGTRTHEHRHLRTEEIYYVLRGKGRMHIEGEARDVGKGDGIAILPGQWHWISNAGKEDLVFLCCCVPAYTHERTVIAGTQARRPAPRHR
jgi:mannose-6-phosphate isomerase-like protein (cupin superfamily)